MIVVGWTAKGKAPVKEYVARENIRRFQAQLAACDDPAQRKTLSDLLKAEKKRLAEARLGDRPRIEQDEVIPVRGTSLGSS
jgi:hypothetical protein